jgi:flavin-dependent dehydrogenase
LFDPTHSILKRAIILGGGLAGLVSGILLNRSGIPVTLIEKKRYPFHRVCGEYISNEAAPFLKDQGIYPSEFSPAVLRRFQLSAVSGKSAQLDLDMGGFGISRYSLDNYLYETGKAEGVDFILDTEVQNVSFSDGKFIVSTMSSSLESDVVIGAFGKRSKLDTALDRDF